VTANDIERFLEVAAEIPVRPAVQTFPLQEANAALRDLKAGHIRGANVLIVK
jgi:propanol-preferring alcohol dehydrogenase